MSKDHNKPDSDASQNDSIIDVFLVPTAPPDARRRLAAAIEMLLRAGVETSGECTQSVADESEDD